MPDDFPSVTVPDLARRLYSQLEPIDAVGRAYLASIKLRPHAALRMLRPDSDFPSFQAQSVLAAPVAAADGRICGIAGRWLDGRGRQAGAWPHNLWSLGRAAGCAARFGMPEATLALTVNIETALRINQTRALPCWASVWPWRLPDIYVPEAVEHVIVFADDDPLSVKATEEAKEWLERTGHSVEIESTWGLFT